MKFISIFFGMGLCAALAASLPLALRALPPPRDLNAELHSDKSYRIIDNPSLFSPPPLQIGPPQLFGRIGARGLPQNLAPGLHLSTWFLNYGHRWEREITFASLIGPFAPEGRPVCDFALRLGAGLFDTQKAGAGIKKTLDQKLSTLFPMTLEESGISIHFPSIDKTDFRIELEDNLALVSLEIKLRDGTLLSARFPMKMGANKGMLSLSRAGQVQSQWTGPTREQARKAGADFGAGIGAGLGILAGLLLGGPTGAAIGGKIGADAGADFGGKEANRLAGERSHSEILRTIDAALGEMSLGLSALNSPMNLFPGRPKDRIQFKLASEPRIGPSGIAFSLCASLNIGEPKINGALPGSLLSAPNTIALPFNEPSGPDNAALELQAGENALNLLIYALFQSGMMRMLGNSEALLSALPKTVQSLAFEMSGFDPELPPAFMAPGDNQKALDEIPFILANVHMGNWGARRVLGHASALLSLQKQGEELALSASITSMTVNCAEPLEAGKTLLTPCLSDLLPAARDMMSERPLQIRLPLKELLKRLPQEPLMNMQVNWSEPRAELRSNPLRLRLGLTPSLGARTR